MEPDERAREGPAADGLPADDQPYWFRGGHPLAAFRSRPALPARVDVVVIGAGLTGASTAYHLADAVRGGHATALVLDSGDPAGEASGRNGGNFELIPENSVGIYEGLARERRAFLHRRYPRLAREVLDAESERQASLVLGIALRNREALKGIILREGISCDFSPRGWLHLASNEAEEQGICDEVLLAARQGQRIEIWSRRRIREELHIDHAFLGRFIPGDGTYHPFKYVCALLQRAIEAGVELYTRVLVREIASEGERLHRVVTSEGVVEARAVVVATNAFTAGLLPELGAIRPHQSQVMLTENAPDRARGRVVTCEDGPVFFNQPRADARRGRAPLLMGGGADRPMRNPRSRRRSPAIHHTLLGLRDRFYPELCGRPASAEWVGAMGFTPDQLPAIGFLRPGVVIAAGYNGYGGSWTTAAGMAAAQMALEGETPHWTPADVFSPRRLLSDEPVFMNQRDGLWRIATALCHQLRQVNAAITEAVTLHAGPEPKVRVTRRRAAAEPRVTTMLRVQPVNITPAHLAGFPSFAGFTAEELERLTDEMVRWDLARGTVLFTEGSPGGSCFVVVRGAVDVSIAVRGTQRLLARLAPGAVFGQVSLVDGGPRSATCTVQADALLAELDRDACRRILADESPLALKLLGALNQGLIAELRDADRQRMRLEADLAPGADAPWASDGA